MVIFNTLGDILLRKYTVDFIIQMQSLQSPLSLFSVRFVSTVHRIDAGTILKIDDLDHTWALRATDQKPYSSLISHHCVWESNMIHLMSLHRDNKETCHYCNRPIPIDIIGLWKMHNFEVYQEL